MTQCEKCGYTPSDTALCGICGAEVLRSLAAFPTLVSTLRDRMTAIKAVATDNVRVDGTAERKLGADMELSARAHALYAGLANWCVGWALALDLAAPAHLADYGHEHAVTGLPEGRERSYAPRAVAEWLRLAHPSIIDHPEAGEYAVLTVDMIEAEARKLGYTPRPRRVEDRRCRKCRAATLQLRWPFGERPTVTCTACGGEWDCGLNLLRSALLGQ